MEATDREFTAGAAAMAVGIKRATLSRWRERHNVLADAERGRSWARYSLVEICTLKLVQLLTFHGVPLNRAISQVNFLGWLHVLSAINHAEPMFLIFRPEVDDGRHYVVTSGEELLAASVPDASASIVVISLHHLVADVMMLLGLEFADADAAQ